MLKKNHSMRALALRGLVLLCALIAASVIGTSAVSSWAGPGDGHDHDHDHAGHMHEHGDHAQGQPSAAQQAKMMENFAEATTMNAHHSKMKMFVGEWDVVAKHWMQPGTEPNVSKAESDCELVMGGRYVRQTYEGIIEFPDATGKMTKHDFKGESMMGYDNVKKQYVSTWVDTMSTGIWMEHGQWDDKENGFVMYSDFIDPMTRQPARTKSIHKFMGKDKMVSEMHKMNGPGQWFKELELTYTRDD